MNLCRNFKLRTEADATFPYFNANGVSLSNVTPAVIRKYHADNLAEGLSPNTVIKHHAVIHSALQQAVATHLIKENVCDLVEKPKRSTYHGDFYNAAEIKTLLLISKDSPIELAIYLAAYFGLRRSEILGLKWNSIDFDNRTISIRHKVVRAKVNGKMTIYATDELKTESSYRTLPLDDFLFSYLTEQKQRQVANRERNGNCHDNRYNAYVCVNELGTLLNPDHVSGTFGKTIRKHKLKSIRFHELSHPYVKSRQTIFVNYLCLTCPSSAM